MKHLPLFLWLLPSMPATHYESFPADRSGVYFACTSRRPLADAQPALNAHPNYPARTMSEFPTELLSRYLGLTIEQNFTRTRKGGAVALEIWVTDLELWADTFRARARELMGRIDALGFEILLVVVDDHPRPHPKPLRLTYMVKHHFTRD